MRMFLNETVLEAARQRTAWIFDHFDHVVVNCSGGKDSTVVLHLALEEATRRGRLPLEVIFLDQEAEWQATVDYVRVVQAMPDVRLHWLQCPIRLSNGTSMDDPWLYCWAPEREAEWVRPKEPGSYHDNVFGTQTFAEVFRAFRKWRWPTARSVSIAGVRCEESPARRLGLTSYETWGGETWGAKEGKKPEQYVWYPIYDWSYTDVWKAIHEHGWAYNKLYDYQYQYGLPITAMRVSNLHHQTAVRNLFYAQEVERETWEKVSSRLKGVHAAVTLQKDFYAPRKLPSMFADWREYRDHLLANLITDPAHQAWFRGQFDAYEDRYDGKALQELYHTEIRMMITGDVYGVALSSFVAAHMHESKNAGARSGKVYT